jgi:hypothetical protein
VASRGEHPSLFSHRARSKLAMWVPGPNQDGGRFASVQRTPVFITLNAASRDAVRRITGLAAQGRALFALANARLRVWLVAAGRELTAED